MSESNSIMISKPFKNIKYQKKNHFYIRQHKGRYIFIDPEGYGFYPIGINHLISLFQDNNYKLKHDPKAEKILLSHMPKWGFNCGGYGLYPKLQDKMYFMGQVNIVFQGFYLLNNYEFPDVFDESFEKSTEDKFKKAREWQYYPDKLIGLVWSDCPAWNIFKSRSLRQNDWVSAIRNQKSNAPGKKAYTSFLLKKYKNKTDKLLEYYHIPKAALNNLDNHNFSKLYLGHPCIISDDESFMAIIAECYYKTGAKYHKKYFPNIPILGDRYLYGDHPDNIIKVASKYIDAVSVQVGDGYGESMLPSYPFPKDDLYHLYKVANKPVLVCDHQISFYTKSYKRTIFSQAGDEKKASEETAKFLKETYSQEYICGYFRCTYINKIAEHNRGVKQGLVDFNQKPYPLMTKAYSSINKKFVFV